MRDLPELLFHGHDLHAVLRNNLEQARRDVDEISERQFLASTDDEIVAHVLSKREVTPLDLREDEMEMDTQETQVDVRHDFRRAIFDSSRPCLIAGVQVSVTVPFSGDADLWKCQPSTFTLNPPRANVHAARGHDLGGYIEIVMARPADTVGDGSELKREVQNTLDSIRGYLDNIRKDVGPHNQDLRVHIRQCVAARRERLGKQVDIAKTLDIPLRRKAGTPDLSALPIKRKLIKPLPTVRDTPPEPGIRDEDYAHILSVIRHEGRSFEATPQTFAKHAEEELRDIILAHLNGHYQGQATGETFRRSGKTDIRIEDGGRAAFVAECKIWRGEKELAAAVDQLLGYLTWRDCKTALIVFNKELAGFSALQAKLSRGIRQHPNHEVGLSTDESGEWLFRLRSAEDPDRKVILHVFLFNLYVVRTERAGKG